MVMGQFSTVIHFHKLTPQTAPVSRFIFSPISNNQRRRPQPKLTMTGNYHLLKRTRISESNEASNVSPESTDDKFNKYVNSTFTFDIG